MNTPKIKKGDTVQVITGRDKGKTGKVIKVVSGTGRVLVEGINLYKKHVRPKNQGEKGQVIMVPRSMDLSNVGILCTSCGNPTRIGYTVSGKKNEKARVCRKCKATI